ncbi:TPA_exp: hypothetical protein A8136_4056 [Trichophyton benhamiae CBS 112371]|nr:TPA_exp: hypothetical protein A8136_4056 [Trichophyton benhamiae CBS 112371]
MVWTLQSLFEAQRLDAKAATVQFWVSILLAAYGATLLLGSSLFGYRSDHFGSRKLPFTLGLVSLCSSTILFAVARTPAVLVISRAFQGLSCAAVWVVGLVLLVDNIPQQGIGQAMGYTTTVPLFVMDRFHWTPSGAGLIFFSSRLSHRDGDLIHYGSLVDRFGARRPGSLAFAVTGVALFSPRFILHNNIPEKVLMGGLLAIVGLGITVVQIISMTEVSQVVIDYEAQSPGILGGKPPMAQAYALFNMAYASGQMLGPVVAGSLQIRTGWSGMTLFFGVASALCALHMGL